MDAAAAFSGRNFMTRRAFERTRNELEQLETALRTTIPQAIQKARELGDLSENAEYHSAKLKQAQAEARILLLAGRLREVVLIDDTVPDPGVVGPGTEVEVDIEGAGTARYWILGEGDGEMSPEVVSYRAPIGLALLGRRPGDATQWSAEGREVHAVVRAIRTRLPDAPASSGRTS
jgi:transcription elongation factor GreA